jgi:LuxR family maltose regulon positive regulatory protein
MILLANDEIAHHHTPAALEWLEKAVQLAAPQHQARPFVSEGKAVWNLLARVQPAAPQFVDYLVQITNTAQQAQEKQTKTLLDQLSEQELRVLKLIASGKSNQEIAGELVISVGTAKWHVHNVLQKLGVSNRAQAIVRARELGL